MISIMKLLIRNVDFYCNNCFTDTVCVCVCVCVCADKKKKKKKQKKKKKTKYSAEILFNINLTQTLQSL